MALDRKLIYPTKPNDLDPNIGLNVSDIDIIYDQGARYNFQVLGAIVNCAVDSITTPIPVTGLYNGQRFIDPDTGELCLWNNLVWARITPQIGWKAFVKDENRNIQLGNSGLWEPDPGGGGGGSGDVIAPATNTDGAIPIWNGDDSKTLSDGIVPGNEGDVLAVEGGVWKSKAPAAVVVPVTSVNGNIGDVVIDDIDISNTSSIPGATVKDALDNIDSAISGITNGQEYQGVWDALNNLPALVSGVGTKNYYYVVGVPGNTNIDGINDWGVNDWIIFNGTVWQKLDNSERVLSVNGQIGNVTVDSDISNNSGVVGATVTEALDELDSSKGDVNGPGVAVDESIALFDGITGKLIKSGSKIGTGANEVVQLDGSGKLPAIDGSNLTNLPIPVIDQKNIPIPATTKAKEITAGMVADGKLYLDHTGILTNCHCSLHVEGLAPLIRNLDYTLLDGEIIIDPAIIAGSVGDKFYCDYFIMVPTAPIILSLETTTDGTAIIVEFGEEMESLVGLEGLFTFTENGLPRTFSEIQEL